jgi:hypothetical protein
MRQIRSCCGWTDLKTGWDIAVNADPIHASLPWVEVCLLLEVQKWCTSLLRYETLRFLTVAQAAVSESHQMAALVGLKTALYMMNRLVHARQSGRILFAQHRLLQPECLPMHLFHLLVLALTIQHFR